MIKNKNYHAASNDKYAHYTMFMNFKIAMAMLQTLVFVNRLALIGLLQEQAWYQKTLKTIMIQVSIYTFTLEQFHDFQVSGYMFYIFLYCIYWICWPSHNPDSQQNVIYGG